MQNLDPLFDDGEYRTPVGRTPRLDEEKEALALDRETSFVTDPADGLPSRKVALHSLDKAHFARYYADIVGTGMKNAYGGPLAWIELFAGPGRLFVKDLRQFKDGSPLEALGIRDPFDHYVFSDLDSRCVDALDRRIGARPGVSVFEGDANAADLHDRIAAAVPRNALTILYADPAGLHLHFSTLRFFAERYKHLDILLNFPVPGVDRALSAGQAAKAGLVLNHDQPIDLLRSGRARTSIREWFERQLAALGYEHFCAQPIKLATKNSPLYDLMLASRERKAKDFFEQAMAHPSGGQRALNLF